MTSGQKQVADEQLGSLLDSGIVLAKTKSEELQDILDNAHNIITAPMPKTNEEKDKVYAEYKETMMSYGKTLGEVSYTFGLLESEYKLLRNAICKDLEYNRQDLFIAIVVKDNFFDKIENRNGWQQNKFSAKDGLERFDIDIHDTTRISHLLSEFKVKGLTPPALTYANIVRKIGDISKVFEHFNQLGESMSESGGNWVQGLGEEDTAVEMSDAMTETDLSEDEERVLVDTKLAPKGE